MALESVDLLTLLNRARKTHGDHGEEEQPPQAAAPVELPPAPQPKEQEQVELEDLRTELFNDEVLLQRILGLLYRCKKKNPNGGFLSILDLEKTLSIEREGATFVMSYMKTQRLIEMDDKSRLAITVPGIDYLRAVLGLGTGSSTAAKSER